jgi:Uma2 family endonuclease
MTDEEREEIRKRVAADSSDRIIITHGTDTMVDTAKYLLGIPNKTIVFTGAMEPARSRYTDATFNVGCAIGAAQTLPPGVYIAMNGRVYAADKVKKNYEAKRFEETLPYGEPTWDIAQLFPLQGAWSVSEYMSLRPSRVVEFVNGQLEIPNVPTQTHQLIAAYLYQTLLLFVTARQLGTVLFAPLRVRISERKYREPDIVFMSKDHATRRNDQFWLGADLVVEIMSESEEDRKRDLIDKRKDYAEAQIPEYWIVDYQEKRITVLTLAGKQYEVHGEFGVNDTATSKLLDGFTIEVKAVFEAAK